MFYLREAPDTGGVELVRVDVKERTEDVVMSGAMAYQLSQGRDKILVQMGGTWALVDAGAYGGESDISPIYLGDAQIRVTPRAEWRQMFEDAWRLNRDYFYDPNMHGVDWNAERRSTRSFCPT